MSDIIISPNMNLPVPIVGTEAGPQYATDINSCLTLVDQHDHSSGYGVQITPSGLNINATLDMNNQILNNSAAINFADASTPANQSLYVTGVDLYFVDGSGNNVRITQSGSVSGSAGTITGLPSGTASASFSAGVFTFQAATATAANIDAGSYVLRNATASSFGLTLAPPNGMGSNYTLTLPALPAQTNVMTLATSGTISSITYDAVGQGMTSVGSNAIAASMNSTGTTSIAATMTAANANTIFAKTTTTPATQADLIAAAMTSTGTTSIAATMTAGNTNTIFGKVSSVAATQANLVGAAMTSAASANVIMALVSTVPATQANLVGAAMTSTGADAVAATMTVTGANAIAADMNATGANSIGVAMTATGANNVALRRTRPVSTSVGNGGVAVSASSGAFSTTSSSSATAVTNLTVTITSNGRPIFVGLTAASGATQSFIGVVGAGSAPGAYEAFISILRDGVELQTNRMLLTVAGATNAMSSLLPVGAINMIDVIGAGTYVYTVNCWIAAGTLTTAQCQEAKLVAYEL